MAARLGARRRCRIRFCRRRSRASACRGAGTEARPCCKAAPGTRAETCSRPAPNSSRCADRPPSRRRSARSRVSTSMRSPAGPSTRRGAFAISPRKAFLVAICLASSVAAASAQGPKLGKPITEADLAPWDISIMPDGTGLPAGAGAPAQGAKLYAERCSACHGDNGKGSEHGAAMVGGPARASLDGGKTIKNYWPYATTLFDFVRRAMPYSEPNSLTSDEVYAITAYILALNELVGQSDTMNAQTLPKVIMPNRDNFIVRFPDRI